jgi:predicted DNA binding protein
MWEYDNPKEQVVRREIDGMSVMYLRYEIEGDFVNRINDAIKLAKQVIFNFDPNEKNIILIFKMDDANKDLKLVAPIDKNIKIIEEVVKNKDKYQVLVNMIKTSVEGVYKDELELTIVKKGFAEELRRQRRKDTYTYSDMYR